MILQTVLFGTSKTNYLNKLTNLEIRVKRDPVTFDLTEYSASATMHLRAGETVPSLIRAGTLIRITGSSPSAKNVTYVLRLSAPTMTVEQGKRVTVNLEAEGMADLYQSAARVVLNATSTNSQRWDEISAALPRPLVETGTGSVRVRPYTKLSLDTIRVFYPTWREDATYLELLTAFARTVCASIMPYADCTGPIALTQINPTTTSSLYRTSASNIELGSTWSQVNSNRIDGAIVNLSSEASKSAGRWQDSKSYNAETTTYGGSSKAEVRTLLSEGYDDIDNRVFPYRSGILRLIGESMYRPVSDWSPDVIKVRTDYGGDTFANLQNWNYPISIEGVSIPAGLRKFNLRGFVVSMTLKSRPVKDEPAVFDAYLELAHAKNETVTTDWTTTAARWADRTIPWTW